RGVSDELPVVGRRLGGIVLTGRRGGAVEYHGLELVAGHATLGVDLVDRHLGALLDGVGRVLVGARDRQRHADLENLLLRGPTARQDDQQPHRQQHGQRTDKPTSNHRVTSKVKGSEFRTETSISEPGPRLRGSTITSLGSADLVLPGRALPSVRAYGVRYSLHD